jgi:hypothetical protein
LSFKSEDELHISYKINNGTWLNLPSQSRVLSFPSLSPGAYKLTLKAINEDGIAVQKPLIFTSKSMPLSIYNGGL